MNNILRSVRTHARMHVFVRKTRKFKTRSNASHLSESRNSELIAHRKSDNNNNKKYISCQRDISCKQIFRYEFVSLCGMACVDEKWQRKVEFSLKIKECLVWRRFDGLIACVHAWLCEIGNLFLLSVADNDGTVATATATATAAICATRPRSFYGCHRHSHFRARDAFFLYNGKTKSAQSSYFIGAFFSPSPQPCKILLWWRWLLLLLFRR